MHRGRTSTLALALALAVSMPSTAQETRPDAGPDRRQRPVRIDPDTDEVLQTIRGVVSPADEQMERIVELYTSLRQEQRRVMAAMRQAMRERRPSTDERLAARQKVLEDLKKLNTQFLDACRALLSAEQIEAWDDCASRLALMPAPPRAGHGRDPRQRGGPAVGQAAPDFELLDVEGNAVSLAALRGKPIVLEFGSYTCPVFRRKVDKIAEVRKHFGNAVAWVLIYTKEAHPTDGRVSAANVRQGIEIPQHTSFEKRLGCAQACTTKLGLDLLVLVDDFDDKVTKAYRGHPNRGYVIDAAGRVASRQLWIDPARTRQVLEGLLAPAPSTRPADSAHPGK